VSLSQRLIVVTLKAFTSLICRINDAELERVPKNGPLIIYTNHINILEIPIIYTHLQPRGVHGLVMAERWRNPILRWMLDSTESIPIQRATADIEAIRKGLEVLAKGEIIIISPEGTRSHDGRLQPAHPGVILLALHSAAPLLPIAYFGSERWHENISRLQRTNFHIRVGKLIQLVAHEERVTHGVRQEMLDELMYQLAELLPEEYRGNYAGYPADGLTYLTYRKPN
jgi:1-acyl-sn-glycerol-3-phosphate acyltransferase